MTKASFVSNKKENIDIVIEPVKDNKVITEATINDMIAGSEYKNLYVDSANIKNAIAELNSVLKPLQNGQTGREIRYQILERRPATIAVSIDKDEMGASAEITTALGGKHLTAKAILNAAQESGVKKGFSKEELVNLAHLAAKGTGGEIVKGHIATGRLAENGNDAQIVPLVQSAQDRILKPKEREDGSVDMRNLGDIICVKVGDPLVKKLPPTPGLKGFKVTGEPLEPTPGNDTELKPGEGTALSAKNENILISTLVGLPRMTENGMEVDEVYKIKTVDVSTGNVNFTGSVIIDGDVCEGMKVIATGDITIGGFVESATLESGGDITIAGGIIGKKHDVESNSVTDIAMSVCINAKGNIFAKYCQYAEINCGGDLRIENQLMHSLIDVSGKLWVGTADKANGKLIGGYIRAGVSVHAGIVGATAGSNTIVNFEEKVADFKEKLHDVEIRLKAESDKTNELKVASNKLKKLPKEKMNHDMLAKITSTYQFHANLMGEILGEKETLEQEMQTYMCSVSIEATEKLYHGVEIIVGDYKDRSRREYGPSRMYYKERKIHIEPILH
ncbi:DUF342 domain-containing protein [Colwelliaceae bacterium 6471]